MCTWHLHTHAIYTTPPLYQGPCELQATEHGTQLQMLCMCVCVYVCTYHTGEHDETLGDSGGNVRTRAPWEAVHGPMRLLNWQLRPQGLAGVVGPAEPGSYEEKKQDALLV